jgi:hypothetical protein
LGGYKQPQQLLILDYFLAIGQEFDLVINIDGFNEVVLSNINNHAAVDISMPSLQHTAPLVNLANNQLSQDDIVTMGNIYQTKDKIKHELEQSDRCSLATCYTRRWFSTQVLFKRYTQEVTKLDRSMAQRPDLKDNLTITKITDLAGNSSVVRVQPTSPVDDAKAMESISKLWVNSSVAMNQILSARGIPYFHFIQPNQYYKTERVFTSEENNTVFILQNNSYADGVQKGYPVLLANIAALQQKNVKIFSAVNVLDQETKTVYYDPCCHYNLLGNEIFTNYIADRVVEVLNEKPMGKPPTK